MLAVLSSLEGCAWFLGEDPSLLWRGALAVPRDGAVQQLTQVCSIVSPGAGTPGPPWCADPLQTPLYACGCLTTVLFAETKLLCRQPCFTRRTQARELKVAGGGSGSWGHVVRDLLLDRPPPVLVVSQ